DIDPVSYKNIHENNVKRTMRALKFYHLTGTPISEHNEAEKKKESPYNSAYFVLTKERSMLYRDIDRRVDIMLGKGLVDEVKGLAEAGCTPGMVSMQAIGYKEVFSYLDGSSTLEETTELIKKNTRHYAKRQLTWFRAVDDAIWIYKDRFESDDEIIAYMKKELEDRGII
ncbi:MAG: tRNA (adenosine(37)-N6)-dimethylallyltransferase MiaA, partial [Lachnospiraceae bacterium]|nr:tRNA (adenosine(37)-N6)-dimethylallyltransferase MiaA [Lachnospiraceae bacterium]